MIAIGSFVLIATAGRCEDLVVRIYSRRFWASFASGHSVAWIVDLASGISTVQQAAKGKKVSQTIAGEFPLFHSVSDGCSRKRILTRWPGSFRLSIANPSIDRDRKKDALSRLRHAPSTRTL
jgi:hypothetical protein